MHQTVKFFIENSNSTVFKNRKVATAIVNTMRESTRYTPNMIEWWLYVIDENFVPGFHSRKWLTSLLARDGWIVESRDMIFDSRKKPSRGTHPNTVWSSDWDEYVFIRGYKADEMLRDHAKKGEYAV